MHQNVNFTCMITSMKNCTRDLNGGTFKPLGAPKIEKMVKLSKQHIFTLFVARDWLDQSFRDFFSKIKVDKKSRLIFGMFHYGYQGRHQWPFLGFLKNAYQQRKWRHLAVRNSNLKQQLRCFIKSIFLVKQIFLNRARILVIRSLKIKKRPNFTKNKTFFNS